MASLQIRVYDRQQQVHSETFSGTVVLGRQRDSKEVLFSSRRDGERARLVIAPLQEDTVSREHACVEPLAGDRIKITNLSGKVSIRLENGSELKAGLSMEVALPATLTLGRKGIRILTAGGTSAEKDAPLRGLAEKPVPPGSLSGGAARFPTMSIQSLFAAPSTGAGNVHNAQLEDLARWLQTTMEVLQSAASSSEFFDKAARGVVEIVGLDRGRVLLREGEGWRAVASWTNPTIRDPIERLPSQQVLNHVLQEKGTFWQSPEDAELDSSGSLVGVEVVVASPILSPKGEIIGAIYGDSRQESYTASSPKITKIEAIVVELLARGVAVGLARMEQEQNAIAARVQFEQFFTKELSEQLAREPTLLEGRDSEVSLLFCDIRGFSRISERLGPEGTVRWIGQVMGTLSDCVLKHQGVLVDYIGDELLAMWGAPVPQPDHARRACLAALEMLNSLPLLNQRWEPILGEPLAIGIGVNTGLARVGNTGSHHKFKYGPLGNPVNLASRVQGATKYLRCPLLVTQYTQAKLDTNFQTRKLCEVRVVNIKQPVELYELAPNERPQWAVIKERYEEALRLFNERQYRLTARHLGSLLGEVTDDGPSLVLMSRAVKALVEGPEETHPVWDLPGK